ncbi:MAG: hypothetical protein K2H37_06040 [Lachnospiraceae bacterium]|nr:hypothetical protein [Lachnospiraceae bacterium]
MLEKAGTMFDNMEAMMYRLKKKAYKERMGEFREKNEEILSEMTEYVEQAEDRDAAAAQVAKALADAVEKRFAKRGKISGRSQMDINLFMIYFVFPAILLTQSEYAGKLADAVRDEWRGRFRNSEQLGYTTYEEISGTFQEKFLGLF